MTELPEAVDYQAGRNFTLGRARVERGVLMALCEVAASNGIAVPVLEKLRREARVRFVDAQGNEVQLARALVTWKD